MRKRGSIALVTLLLLFGAVPLAQADSEDVVRFATLPKSGPGFPEGIAADAAGNIYVATFNFLTPTPPDDVIHVFAQSGRLRTTIPLPAGVRPLGMEFDAAGNLWVADFGNGNLLKFTPQFTSSSTPTTVAVPECGGPSAGCGLNAITFDAAGNLYVSDSFGGRVFKRDALTGVVSIFVADDLLTPGTHGFPPFGANGLAFDAAGANLYIANTADDRILKYNVAPATLTTFAESINGADGIVFDAKGRLWAVENQNDDLVALNANGRIVERRGSFKGISRDGAPRGLSSRPASSSAATAST